MPANRRKYVRLQTENFPCQFELDGRESEAVVVNESIEGIQIGGIRLRRLSLDQKVSIHYKGETLVGRCRSIARNDDGSFRIGIHRENAEYEQSSHVSFLLNTFMECSEFNIVCATNESDDSHLHIQLIDGKTFWLEQDRVLELTRDERRAELLELEADERFENVTAIYGSMTSRFDFSKVESVLDQEFGPPAQRLVG